MQNSGEKEGTQQLQAGFSLYFYVHTQCLITDLSSASFCNHQFSQHTLSSFLLGPAAYQKTIVVKYLGYII